MMEWKAILGILSIEDHNCQDFTPCIHITDSDFASITKDGTLCDAKGQLGPDEFADVIRRQVGA